MSNPSDPEPDYRLNTLIVAKDDGDGSGCIHLSREIQSELPTAPARIWREAGDPGMTDPGRADLGAFRRETERCPLLGKTGLQGPRPQDSH